MSEIALKFLIANLAAGAAILLVIALRKPARATFGAGLTYGLWLLVPLAALASLLPPRIVEIVRPAPDIAMPLPLEPALAANAAPVYQPVEAAAAAPRTAIVRQPLPPIAPASPPLDPWTIATLVWLAGAVVTLAWQLRNQSRFMADARAGFAGPAVAGLFRPRIITPADFEDRFEPSEREVVLAHETIHLDRNDARINAAVALARSICWFNPLIHLAAHLMRIDQELACDAAVVARYPRARSAYGTALLKAELAARPLPLGCYWPARSEHPLTERIEMLKRTIPGRARRLAGAAAILVLAGATSAAAWAALPPQQRLVDAPAATASSEEAHLTPAPAPQQTASQPAAPLQQPAPAPQQGAPLQPSALPINPSTSAMLSPFPSEPSVGSEIPGSIPLEVNKPIYLRGRVERIDFGRTSYVLHVRANSISRSYSDDRPNRGYASPAAVAWELSPTNYFGDADAIRADLMGKDIEVSGVNLNQDCKPGCKLKVKQVYVPRSGEVPLAEPTDSTIGFFNRWYDGSTPVSANGRVERIEFSDRTFDAYVRTAAQGLVPSRLMQVRSAYRYPRADIEREIMGKPVSVSGWAARTHAGFYCSPVCGMYSETILVGTQPGPWVRVTPDGPELATPLQVVNGRLQAPLPPLRILPLKRERLQVTTGAGNRLVDRYFEPGALYYLRVGFGWTVSTPDGSAFEWRVNDTSAGPLAGTGPVTSLKVDDIAQRLNVPTQPQPSALRLVALKRERLEITSRDMTKFVDRYFEPGDYYVVSTGGDWMVSTPDGAAFEWRWGDASFGALGNAGPVNAVSVDAVADRVWRTPAQPVPQASP
jgi:beta-lactamase regulating signal transducer with metallopeptidase domain